MNDTTRDQFLQGCETAAQRAAALLAAIACTPHLSPRDKLLAQGLISDGVVRVFQSTPVTPLTMAQADTEFQSFKLRLLAKPRRVRKSRKVAA